MQPPYPPPYGQQPYGQQPQAGFGQQPFGQQPQPWNAGPPAPVDPLKLPLRLAMAGLAVGVLSSVIALVVNGRFYLGVISRFGFPLIAYAGLALLVAASAILGTKKQPGHQLAMVAAGVYAVDLLFAMFAPKSGYESHLPQQTMFFVSLTGRVLAAAAITALAVSLLQLGRARGRSIDVAAFLAIGLTALSFVVSTVFSLPFLGHSLRYAGGVDMALLTAFLLGVLGLAARAILILGTAAIVEGPVAPGNVKGNIVLGFLAGFFGGCLGLGLVLAIAKGTQTKRGASIGFSAQVIVGILLNGLRH
jgi:hypothetical protein